MKNCECMLYSYEQKCFHRCNLHEYIRDNWTDRYDSYKLIAIGENEKDMRAMHIDFIRKALFEDRERMEYANQLEAHHGIN